MEKEALIGLLNRDLADEHAAIIRYLVHGWMEGEDTPLGSSLISISREEMWDPQRSIWADWRPGGAM